MRKLPAKAARFLLPLVLTFFMTCIVSGLSTWLVIGGSPGWGIAWLRAWMSSWAIAFPTMLFVMPLARRIVDALVATPPRTP